MKTRIDFSRAFSLTISLLASGAVLLALVVLTAGVIPAAAAPAQSVCHATPDGGTTVYNSTDSADALRQAVTAASPGSEVWVAGTCPGAVTEGGSTQVVLLNKDLTLKGYTYDTTWQYVRGQRAIIDANNGGRVIRVVGNVDVVLDNLRLINGRTSADGAGVEAGNATLTVSNSVLANNNAEGSDSAGGAITTYRSLTISGTRFISNTAAGRRAGAVLSRAAGDDTLVITNAHFENNHCTDTDGCAGGALFTYNPVAITGSTFTGNSATGTGFASGGGAIYALAEVDIRGSLLSQNQTDAHGGAIYVQAPMTLQDSEIVDNTSGRHGGGIWNSGALVVDNTLIARNQSTQNNYSGGGIYNSGSLSLLASDVLSNEADSSGGIHNVAGASLTIAGNALFRANQATGAFGSGGGVRNHGTMVVEDAVFEANDGSSAGGGIANSGNLTAGPVTFRNNVAESAGALSNGGDATISDALFEGNRATGVLTELSTPGGGAIRNGNFGSLSVADSTFRNNQAVYRGGAFYNAGRFQAELALVNTKVISNSAESGGGFYLMGDASVAASRIFSNSASTVGGGLTIGGSAVVSLQNNFIAGNISPGGGDAIYFDSTGEEGSVLATTHDTFVGSNDAGSGTAIESAGSGNSQEATLTNVILSDYAIGVQLGGITDSATIDGILWHDVGTTTTGGNVTVTNAYTGQPQFVNPGSANYHIQPTSPAVDKVDTTVDRDIDFEPRPIGPAADLGADEVGNDRHGLGNYVWEDIDADGLQDAAESGLAGVTVNLLDDGGQVLSTTTTNDAGFYFFALDTAGDYRIEFVAPADYRFSPANQGDDDTEDSDAQPGTGLTPLFSFPGDTIDHTWDAGISSTLPDLFIDKTIEPSQQFIDPGRSLTYRLTFGNDGAGVAHDVVLTDMVPTDLLTDITYEVEGVSVTPMSGMTYTWQVEPLPAGIVGTIEIRGTVREGLSAGTPITNAATIAGSDDEQSTTNNSDDVLVTVNDAAPIAFDDRGFGFTTNPGTVFTTANVLANDRDPNGGELTVISVDTSGLRGELTNNGDGTFTYDPAGAFDHVGLGQTATDVFTYAVSDEGGNTATATVTITIDGEGYALYLPIIIRDGAVRANRP